MQDRFDGWLNIYKEKGKTSFSISRALKKKFNFKKLGHLGTLDPQAEGVLPIAIGEATKSIKFITNNKKKYSFIIKWGEETDTCDSEGRVIKICQKRPSYDEVNFIVNKFFLGEINQVPPIFSAVKIGGIRAYKLARKNIKFQIKEKKVKISKLVVKKTKDKNFCKFEVVCSKGTYVRALARDIARKLGTAGFAYEIIRTEDNIFKIKDSTPLENILRLSVSEINKKLLPIESALDNVKIINLEKKYSVMLKNGIMLNLKSIKRKIDSDNKLILVKADNKLVSIAYLKKEYIIPRRNFNL